MTVPDVERGPDGSAGVARGRLDVELVERRLRPDAPVRDRVERDPARQAEVPRARSLSERPSKVEHELLEPGLQRGRDVHVPRRALPRLTRAGPSSCSSLAEKIRPTVGRARLPRHLDPRRVVGEELEREPIRAHRPLQRFAASASRWASGSP